MNCEKFYFSNFDRMLDEVHRYFASLDERYNRQGEVYTDLLYRTRLALHEWLANLLQHATFGEREPEVIVTIYRDDEQFRCQIEDNSDGFDFDTQLDNGQDILEAFPERGMGLMMIKACASHFAYVSERGRHSVEIVVEANHHG
jgi:serine/threonine-protein kinase RsbW